MNHRPSKWDIMTVLLNWFQDNASKLLLLLIVLVIAIVSTKILSRLMRKALDRSQIPSASIFINIMRVLIWVIAVTVVMQPVFGINPSTLITALGVGGIALSLGLKDTIANIVGGFSLMLGKVIQPGDLISVAGSTGTVTDITWRQTIVRERNGNSMVIPNSVLNTAALERLTPANESLAAVPFTARAGYGHDEITNAILHAIQPAIREYADPQREPVVKFTGFSPYGIEGEVWVFARRGVFISTVKDATTRALVSCDYLEQRAAGEAVSEAAVE